jgi:hypothetical protein
LAILSIVTPICFFLFCTLLSKSNLGKRTVTRFLAGEDVKISTVESITHLSGLDFAGNETLSINELEQNRAKEKALYMLSLVQDTSSLEQQGLDNEQLNLLIKNLIPLLGFKALQQFTV